MPVIAAHVRRSGRGPMVVCLHGNAGTSAQWESLGERLADRFTVVAVDALGAGGSPAWPDSPGPGLAAELALLEPLIRDATGGVHLVGHGYGGALAFAAAVEWRSRVRSVAAYDPLLFWLLGDDRVYDPAIAGAHEVAASAAVALHAGDSEGAARLHVDFWSGEGAWDATPARRRPALARAVRDLERWYGALFTEPDTPLRALATLDVPVLLMLGGRSPASATAPARHAAAALPQAEVVVFDDLGHMGPITHPSRIDAMLELFLTRVERGAAGR